MFSTHAVVPHRTAISNDGRALAHLQIEVRLVADAGERVLWDWGTTRSFLTASNALLLGEMKWQFSKATF